MRKLWKVIKVTRDGKTEEVLFKSYKLQDCVEYMDKMDLIIEEDSRYVTRDKQYIVGIILQKTT